MRRRDREIERLYAEILLGRSHCQFQRFESPLQSMVDILISYVLIETYHGCSFSEEYLNMIRLSGLVALAVTLATPALAGPTLSFNLDQISSPTIGSGILGTVVLTQVDLDKVDVKVTVAPDLFVNTGGPHTPFAFNTTLSGLRVAFVTPVNGVYPHGTFSYNSAGGANTPYGNFSQAIDSTAGNGSGNGYGGTLEFTVSRGAGIDTTDFGHNV